MICLVKKLTDQELNRVRLGGRTKQNAGKEKGGTGVTSRCREKMDMLY